MVRRKILFQTDRDEDRIASEKACHKPAGNSIRLKKKRATVHKCDGWTYKEMGRQTDKSAARV